MVPAVAAAGLRIARPARRLRLAAAVPLTAAAVAAAISSAMAALADRVVNE
jgi:hypothetical protein